MRWATLLDVLFPPSCAACGAVGTGLCTRCFHPASPIAFTLDGLACTSLGLYDGHLRTAVLALKSGRRDVAQTLGELLGRAVPGNVDALVPVPTAAGRRRRRGFDQGELLAATASAVCDVPAVRALRHFSAGGQRGRSRSERLAAVGRFTLKPASVAEGTRVLLVDDVATTGATLRDSAHTLREHGVVVVGGLVVARACDV